MFEAIHSRFTCKQFELSFSTNVVLLWQAIYYQSLLQESVTFEWINRDACQVSGLTKDAFFRARRQLITHGFLHVSSQPGSPLAVYTLLFAEQAEEETKAETRASHQQKAKKDRGVIMAQPLDPSRLTGKKAVEKATQRKEAAAQVKAVELPEGQADLEQKSAELRSKSFKVLKKNLRESQLTPTTNAACYGEISEYFDLSCPNQMMTSWLTSWFQRVGVAGVDLLIQALEETREADRPSWRYTKTLLFNWEKSGFRSLEDVIASDDERLEKQFTSKQSLRQKKRRRGDDNERTTRSIREEYPSADF